MLDYNNKDYFLFKATKDKMLDSKEVIEIYKNTLFIPKMILSIRKAELFGLTDLINNFVPNLKKINCKESNKTSYIKTDNYINNKNIEIKQKTLRYLK